MKGPKGILAEAISNALAEYFVIDQKNMETKLLSNAGIKLRDIQLQPQDEIIVNPTTTASIRGLVQYVAFEWNWGKSQKEGGSDWVKDAKLSISGLRFTITLAAEEASEETAVPKEGGNGKHHSKQKPDNKEASTGIMAYVEDQVQRILDTLTLAVNNVQFTVILPDGSNVQFGGLGMQIQSMGRTLPSTPIEEGGAPAPNTLLQQFQISQMFASVTSNDGESFPVLEDIFYEAHIQRSVGNRFQSGLERGLRVEGDSDAKGVVIHVGPAQLEILNSLVGMLVNPSSGAATGKIESCSSDTGNSSSGEEQDRFVVNSPTLEGEPSFMGLKLSGVSLVLPNGAKLSLADLILKYQLDGSVLRVEGRAGFSVDGIPFLALGETSAWSADLVEHNFRVNDTAVAEGGNPGDEVVVFLNARQAQLQRVSEGLNQALGIYKRLGALEGGAVSTMTRNSETIKKPKESTSASAWTIELLGKIGCVVEQGSNSDIIMTLRNVMANTDTMTVILHSVDECQIPGVMHLADPVVDTILKFNGSSLSAMVQDVVVVLEEQSQDSGEARNVKRNNPQESSPHTSDDEDDVQGAKFDGESSSSTMLTFGVRLTVKKFLAFKPDGKSVQTTVETLNLQVDPISEPRTKDTANARIRLTLNEFNHDMVRLRQPILQIAVDLASAFDSLYEMRFGANEIMLAAGYSLGDWKALIPTKRRQHDEAEPLKLPYAHIDHLKVNVLVKGLVGVKDSIIRVSPFDGKETTTMEDVAYFYKERVITQVPGMIADTEVLGTNLGDGVVGHFGGGLLGNVVGGAGIGGILSVAAFDGVKNTIKAGKVSRGVEETDKWQLSDLATGLKYSAICRTREGAAMRGKREDEGADAIDWAVGTTADVGKYTVENKARLGGAGAGAVGFAYGFALGGPIGAIAGTIIASATTQRTIEKVDEALKGTSIHTQKQATDDMIKVINGHMMTDGDEIIQHGFLLKRRDFFKWDWRPHCFVLAQDELRYYELTVHPPKGSVNKEGVLYMDSSKGPLKALKIDNHRVAVSDDISNASENLFVFTIHTSEKSEPLWVLAAPTEQLRSAWVLKLNEQMSRNSTGIKVLEEYATSCAPSEDSNKD